MGKEDPEITSLKEEVNKVIAKFQEDQKAKSDVELKDKCSDMGDIPKIRLATKKLLKGHINKVTACHYSGDSRHCVTGSLDGKLIIWDSWTGNKIQIIPLRSSWVMSVAFSPSGNFVACGGMDNMCTIYDINNRDASGVAKIVRELAGYEGFLSSCRFLDDNNILTGSGDSKIMYWDISTGKKSMEFDGHVGDVVSISMSPDMNQYVTGSVDRTCKLWDVRTPTPKQQFFSHTSDVNSVCFHPSGFAFASASEDKQARVFDIRSDQVVGTYAPPKETTGLTSIALSFSGRYVICGSDDNHIHAWDSLKTTYNGHLSGHENRITSIAMTPNGMALCSCSWDNNVRIWV